jgi:hypothetical protein
MLLWSIKYQHGYQPILLHSLYDNRMIIDMPKLYVGHRNTYTGIRTSKCITFITRGTFTVCLLFVMFFMSVLVDIHLVKISDCAKNVFLFRSFTGDIMMGVKTCVSQRHCTELWPMYSYVCMCLLLLIELQLLNWFCAHNEPPILYSSHPKQESNHHPRLAGTHSNEWRLKWRSLNITAVHHRTRVSKSHVILHP